MELAAVDLNSSTLMVWNHCERRPILKDNSWIYILHQYHKVNRFIKSCTVIINPLLYVYFFNTQFKFWFDLLENNIILFWECFHNLNRCIFIENTLKCNASWVIFNIGASTKFSFLWLSMSLFEGIWNNYIDIQPKSMQVRFILWFCMLEDIII